MLNVSLEHSFNLDCHPNRYKAIKSGVSSYLMYSCQVLDKYKTNINVCYRLSIFCQLMLCDESLTLKYWIFFNTIIDYVLQLSFYSI